MPRTTPKPIPEAPGRTDLGRRIAARRAELGLTREQVGSRCGADASYIAYLEEKAAAPGSGSLVRLADALGTTVAELSGATTAYPPGRGTARLDSELISLDEAECRRLLSTHGIGRVGIFTPEGPAIFPVNYVVAGAEIAFRTTGDALLARAAGTEVAFEVDHIDDAMRQGWSVLAVGEVSGVTDGDDIQRLNTVARSLPWAGGHRTHWMSVAPTRITGRRVVHQ
ncbi:pyridoxamine 5'-phosphate oxidase family protein [Streptomyces sp. G-G2]|uniref:helix-turn-helix domain-containing protein n=1 Tax=Streptomyces sp. G-G2 TaxID=3046201 RepID=UPI0024B939C7|nr:pyridoxamine 5'-phosphate oxidase family protein [Streptomyces sp. G-G2]MDJ0383539.1 pyridoxamine 5'-phosphate oxidase family protein [Streptomyces sp. G-G2]